MPVDLRPTLSISPKRGTGIAPSTQTEPRPPAACLTSSLPLRAKAIDSRAPAVSDLILRITSPTTGLGDRQTPLPSAPQRMEGDSEPVATAFTAMQKAGGIGSRAGARLVLVRSGRELDASGDARLSMSRGASARVALQPLLRFVRSGSATTWVIAAASASTRQRSGSAAKDGPAATSAPTGKSVRTPARLTCQAGMSRSPPHRGCLSGMR
jgi:hypothetical protein